MNENVFLKTHSTYILYDFDMLNIIAIAITVTIVYHDNAIRRKNV